MKKIICSLFLGVAMALFISGCQITVPTTTTVKTVDPKTGVETTTETSESALKSFLESTKGKLVHVSRQGWAGGIYFVPPASDSSNPAGVLKIVAGKEDDTYTSVPMQPITPDVVTGALGGIEGIIAASRSGDISLTGTGISAKAGDTTTNTK